MHEEKEEETGRVDERTDSWKMEWRRLDDECFRLSQRSVELLLQLLSFVRLSVYRCFSSAPLYSSVCLSLSSSACHLFIQ